MVQTLRTLKFKIRNAGSSIKNLIYYFKIIWEDKPWDHQFIEYLLEKKLNKSLNYFTKIHRHTSSETIVKSMRICCTILERRRTSWYADMTWSRNLMGSMSHELRNNPDYGLHAMRVCEQRDWKLLWKIMEKYMEIWWD